MAERANFLSDVESVARVREGFRSDLGFVGDMMQCYIGNQYKILRGIIVQTSNT